jgi:hypothetical protein
MPKRPPPDVSALTPWVEWERIVERVRGAKDAESAVYMMKRHFKSVLEMQDALRDTKLKREYDARQAFRERHLRVREMAKAMAGPDREWGQFHERACELDDALQARKKFEI